MTQVTVLKASHLVHLVVIEGDQLRTQLFYLPIRADDLSRLISDESLERQSEGGRGR